jgi:hypothetical protein
MYLLMKNFLMFIRLSPSLFYDYYVYFLFQLGLVWKLNSPWGLEGIEV